MVEIVRLVDKFEDKRIKDKGVNEFNAYLSVMGSNIRLKLFLDSEITGIDLGRNIADRVALGVDGIFYIIENEYRDPSEMAKSKLLHYGTALLKNFDKIVENIKKMYPDIEVKKCIVKVMVILNPTGAVEDISISPNCGDEKYKIITLSPANIDGEKGLKNIRFKIENNIELNLEDLEILESLVYSKPLNEKHKALLEASEIVNSIPGMENKKERLNIIFQQQCIRYVKKEFLDETLEVLLMAGKGLMEEYNDNLREEGYEYGMEDGIKKGMNDGIKKGRDETIDKVVDTLKENGVSKEIISAILQIIY